MIASVAPDASYIEIDEKFRETTPQWVGVHQLSNEQKHDIFRLIGEWAVAKRLDLETIYRDERDRSQNYRANVATSGSNGLHRLIEAQEPDLRKRIQIPGDIALALMGLE